LSGVDFASVWKRQYLFDEMLLLIQNHGQVVGNVCTYFMLSISQGSEMKNEGWTVKLRIWAGILIQNLSTMIINVLRGKETQQQFKGIS
jgi:hypothetical protein